MHIIKILNKILKLILLIFLILDIFIVTLFYVGNELINRKNLGDYIKTSEILNMNINVIFNNIIDNKTIKDKIFELAIKNKIPPKIINDVLSSEEINLLLGDYFNNVIYYLTNSTLKPKLDEDTINKIINVSKESLDNHINEMMSFDELKLHMINFCNDLVNIMPEKQEFIGIIPISYIKLFLEFNWYILFLPFIIILLLYVLLTKSFYKVLRYLGLAFLICGVTFVIIGSFNNVIGNFIIDNIINLKILISPLVTIFLTLIFKKGVLISFIGLFIMLLYIIINRIKLNKI